MDSIDVDHLRKIAEYNPKTGVVTWRKRGKETFRNGGPYAEAISERWNKHRAGNPVGHISPHGYVVTTIEKKTVMVHRMAWAIHFGRHPKGQIDHISGAKNDNRLENLREVSAGENSRNRKKPVTNSSGLMGVHFHKQSAKWHARIMVDGVRRHLGAFEDPKEAHRAYVRAKQKFDFHKNHGR